MALIDVYTKNGKKSGTVEVSPCVFDIKITAGVKRMLDLVTRLYANNKRTGLAHTKTRAEVRGGGVRPWKQKGTGRARVSSIRSPLWRKGGIIHGPRRREIYNTIPEKIRAKALAASLSVKVQNGTLLVVDDLTPSAPKTKEMYQVLENLKINDKKSLMVAKELVPTLDRAARNIETVTLKRVTDINGYHVMRKAVLVTDIAGIKALEERVLARLAAAKPVKK